MGAHNLMQIMNKKIRPSKELADYNVYYKLIKLFPLQSITSRAQYKKSLRVLEFLLDSTNFDTNTNKGKTPYVKTLAQLIENYEASHFSKASVSSEDMLKYLMKLKNTTQAELAPVLGGQSVASNILNKRRCLNVRQIKALSVFFKVSPQVFL